MLLIFAKGTYVVLSVILFGLALWSLIGAVVIDHRGVSIESVALAGIRLVSVFVLWKIAERFHAWAKVKAEFY